MNDEELMLWAFVHRNARWEHKTNEFCVGGIRYSCQVGKDTGLPFLTEHLRSKLQRDFEKWKWIREHDE